MTEKQARTLISLNELQKQGVLPPMQGGVGAPAAIDQPESSKASSLSPIRQLSANISTLKSLTLQMSFMMAEITELTKK